MSQNTYNLKQYNVISFHPRFPDVPPIGQHGKIQFTDSMDLSPQIQAFQDNYSQMMSNGHSKLSKDLATFMFCSSLPDTYKQTTQRYLDNITAITNYQLTDINMSTPRRA